MARIQITGFDGAVPRTSATMLGERNAQTAKNVKLYGQELNYWDGSTEVYSPGIAGLTSVYRLYSGDDNIWLGWDTQVDVAESPVADVSDRRIYYTGDGGPKKTNYALASASTPYPASYYDMGVPAPTNAAVPSPSGDITAANYYLTIGDSAVAGDDADLDGDGSFLYDFASRDATSTQRGGSTSNITLSISETVVTSSSGNLVGSPNNAVHRDSRATSGTTPPSYVSTDTPAVEARTYVYTFISEFGTVREESAPSPASALVDVRTEAVTLSGLETTAPPGTNNIVAKRIYRSVVGASTTSFQFVAEIPLASATYTDSVPTAELGEVIPSIGWTEPPTALSGIVSLPGGVLAGFVGNTVYFSEPFFPHAWPIDYTISIPYDIIGLGVTGQSLAVMTVVQPYIISGNTPGAMTVDRLPIKEPCVSKASITSDGLGVLYASPNGLVSVGGGAANVITNNLYRRDEWQALGPSGLSGITFDGKYIGIFNDVEKDAIVISRDDIPALSTLAVHGPEAYIDERDAELYVVNTNNSVDQIDISTLEPLEYLWRSKRFVLPRAVTLSRLCLDADYTLQSAADEYNDTVSDIYAANAVAFASPLLGAFNDVAFNVFDVNGSTMQNVPGQASTRYAQVMIYGDDGELEATVTPTSYDPVILPPFKSREIEIEIVGNIPVRSVTLATTIEELKQ